MINRAYKRCSTECSAPPMYIFTGSQFFALFISKAVLSISVDRYLKKYQALSRKLSETSVSLFAGLLQFGQKVFIKLSTVASGDLPVPVGFHSLTSGKRTGRSFSCTGNQPRIVDDRKSNGLAWSDFQDLRSIFKDSSVVNHDSPFLAQILQ